MSSSTLFRSDLRQALAVWRSHPWLPVVSVVLGLALWGATALPMSPMVRPLVALVVLVTSLAWWGLERVVYDRVWTSGSVRWPELARLAPTLAGRFFRLGLAVGLAFLLLTSWAAVGVPEPVANVANIVLATALWAAFAFVTPALVFDEPKVRGAVARGWAMLVAEGRPAVWHIVAPAVALTGIGLPSVLSGQTAAGALGTGVAALVSLAGKGAALAYYRRAIATSGHPSGSASSASQFRSIRSQSSWTGAEPWRSPAGDPNGR